MELTQKTHRLKRYAIGKKRGINHSKTRTYSSWYSMITRCSTPSYKNYHRWGGRGIKVCSRWSDPRNGYKYFLEDMGERPEGHTLDRIDVNGDYSPDNCRWATRNEQMRNTSTNVHIMYKGKDYTASGLGELLGIKPATILYRHRHGLRIDSKVGDNLCIKTHCKAGHDLFDPQVVFYRKNGQKECRLCANERMRKRREKLRSEALFDKSGLTNESE